MGCGDRRTEVRASLRRTAEEVGHTCLYPLKRKETVYDRELALSRDTGYPFKRIKWGTASQA